MKDILIKNPVNTVKIGMTNKEIRKMTCKGQIKYKQAM